MVHRILQGLILFSAVLLWTANLCAQTSNKMNNRLTPLLPEKEVKASSSKKIPLLLLFYRNYITNQDGNGCQFNPTCSVYAVRKIKEKGLLLGLLDGADRLCRCGHHLYLYSWNMDKEYYEDKD